MPAEISMISMNGQSFAELALGSGRSAWHSLGTVFPGLVSKDEAIRIAMPWTAHKVPLLLPRSLVLEATGHELKTNQTEMCAILRGDNNRIIGYTGLRYEVLQPSEMFNFTEGLNVPGYETAGALKGGSVLFLCAHVGEIDVLSSGDTTRTYLTFLNSFDGSISAQVYMSGVRIVCMNTLRASLGDREKSSSTKFRHTRTIHSRLQQASQFLSTAQATEDLLKEKLETLAKRKLNRDTYESILDDLFGEGSKGKTKNIKAEVSEIFLNNDGDTFPQFKGTAYSAYQAITNYVDHSKGVRITDKSTSQDVSAQRFESALIGSGMELKERALERILVLSKGSEEIQPKYFSIPEPVKDYPITEAEYTPIWDSPLEETEETTDNETIITLYTTAPSTLDMLYTYHLDTVEQVSDTVCVRKIEVRESYLNTQKALYESEGYVVFTDEKWSEMHP